MASVSNLWNFLLFPGNFIVGIMLLSISEKKKKNYLVIDGKIAFHKKYFINFIVISNDVSIVIYDNLKTVERGNRKCLLLLSRNEFHRWMCSVWLSFGFRLKKYLEWFWKTDGLKILEGSPRTPQKWKW